MTRAKGGFQLSSTNHTSGLSKFFLVLLRIAIGWHLGYEGWTKIQSHREGKAPFSSEMYLRNASGPLRDHFRGLVDDLHGERKLDAAAVEADWTATVERFEQYFDFDAAQRERANQKVAELKEKVAQYLDAEPTAKAIKEYREKLAEAAAAEAKDSPPFARDQLRKARGELEAKRRELTGPVADLTAELRQELASIAGDKPMDLATEWKFWWSDTPLVARVDKITMWGLFLCGGGMVVGLFSRLSALGGAALLTLFYLSNPPLPGLPPAPNAEGTYLFVNKNLVEQLACLALATMPTGVWGGLDALIRGLITRPLFGVGAREYHAATR